MKFKHSLWILVSLFLVTACDRDEDTKDYRSGISMSQAQIIPLKSSISDSTKRGFADFNCDGIEDMVEINNNSWWGQNYEMNVFLGNRSSDNHWVEYAQKPIVIKVPIKMKWFSDSTKIDTADVNGDGCADIIFTQYTSGAFSKDKIHFAFALNDGQMNFNTQTEDLSLPNGKTLMDSIVEILSSEHYDSDNLNDYLKMDWADFDGNGSDDLILMWNNQSNMDINILYTGRTRNKVSFIDSKSFSIPNFLSERSIKYVDTEDYDGNGLADIVVYNESGSILSLGFALNNGEEFIPYKDVKLNIPKGLDWFSTASKRDTMRIDEDNKADFMMMANQNGSPVRIVYLSQIPSLENKSARSARQHP